MTDTKEAAVGNENVGSVASIAVALLIAAVLLGVNFATLNTSQPGYMSLYVLDSQGQAVSPQVLAVGKNSTVNFCVIVENHMSNVSALNCQVLVKTVKGLSCAFPVTDAETAETFTAMLEKGAVWNNAAAVSFSDSGSCSVVFELWNAPNASSQAYEFSGLYCVLNMQVST